MYKLPQELTDKIIGSIDRANPSGHSALLACSRVGRSWRRQAQKELFFRVSFLSVDHLEGWDRNISPESEIPSFVRQLLWGALPTRIEASEGLDPFLENTFPGRFASFSNIEDLHISGLSLPSLENAMIERTFSPIGHSLRSLQIDNLTADPEKWCFLISFLPSLRHLSIFSATMLERERGPGLDDPPSFNFTGHITTYNHRAEQFFRHVASLRPCFTSLGVFEISDSLVETLNLVLKSCSNTLTALSIFPLSRRTPRIETMEQLDLSPCNNLRVLRVVSHMAGPPTLCTILNTISSKRFEKLMIGPAIETVPASWKETDQVLHSFAEKLYKLGAKKPLTVVLGFFKGAEGEEGMPDIERLWPLFCGAGVIVKEDTDSDSRARGWYASPR